MSKQCKKKKNKKQKNRLTLDSEKGFGFNFFYATAHFYTPGKHPKTSGFPMFSGGIRKRLVT